MSDYHGVVGQVFRDVRVSNIGITRALRHIWNGHTQRGWYRRGSRGIASFIHWFTEVVNSTLYLQYVRY